MPSNNGYDFTITLKKFFTGLLLVLVPEVILYSINFCESQDFPIEYIWAVPLIVAFLHALLNTVKHWND